MQRRGNSRKKKTKDNPLVRMRTGTECCEVRGDKKKDLGSMLRGGVKPTTRDRTEAYGGWGPIIGVWTQGETPGTITPVFHTLRNTKRDGYYKLIETSPQVGIFAQKNGDCLIFSTCKP